MSVIPQIENKPTWVEELRIFFDKELRPRKPTMKNLEREMLVDFVKKEKTKSSDEVIKIVEDTISEFGDQGIEVVAGILEESFHGGIEFID